MKMLQKEIQTNEHAIGKLLADIKKEIELKTFKGCVVMNTAYFR